MEKQMFAEVIETISFRARSPSFHHDLASIESLPVRSIIPGFGGAREVEEGYLRFTANRSFGRFAWHTQAGDVPTDSGLRTRSCG